MARKRMASENRMIAEAALEQKDEKLMQLKAR